MTPPRRVVGTATESCAQAAPFHCHMSSRLPVAS